jgi:hypothetical protein
MKLIEKLFGPRRSMAITGEQTFQQGIAQGGVGVSQLPGFIAPQPGTYEVYRRMSAHPTISLARSIVTAPILASSWTFETRRPDGKKRRPGSTATDAIDHHLDERSQFIQRQMESIRTPFLVEALRALEFGWRPFEKIFDVRAGRIVLSPHIAPVLILSRPRVSLSV